MKLSFSFLRPLYFFALLLSSHCLAQENYPIVRLACTVSCDDYAKAAEEAARELGVGIQVFKLKDRAGIDLTRPRDHFDAILSPGGHDIDLRYFLSEAEDTQENWELKIRAAVGAIEGGLTTTGPLRLARDEFEFRLMTRYLSDETYRDVPMLGVCYGMQMAGAVVGLPLFVDINYDLGIPARRFVNDEVQTTQNSLVDHLLGSSFKGLKNHHQALSAQYWKKHREKFPRVKISAESHEGQIAEALEIMDRPYLGLQFHPERSESRVRSSVFKWLVKAALEGKQKHAKQ